MVHEDKVCSPKVQHCTAKDKGDSPNKYSDTDIILMEFLIDQQTWYSHGY